MGQPTYPNCQTKKCYLSNYQYFFLIRAILLVALGVAFIRYRKIPLKPFALLFLPVLLKFFIIIILWLLTELTISLSTCFHLNLFFSLPLHSEIINKPIKKSLFQPWFFDFCSSQKSDLYGTIFSPLENQLYLNWFVDNYVSNNSLFYMNLSMITIRI